MKTDVIDLYQVHWPDLEIPIAETARTLEDLRREGKIRAIGVSNYSPVQMDVFRTAARLDRPITSLSARSMPMYCPTLSVRLNAGEWNPPRTSVFGNG